MFESEFNKVSQEMMLRKLWESDIEKQCISEIRTNEPEHFFEPNHPLVIVIVTENSRVYLPGTMQEVYYVKFREVLEHRLYVFAGEGLSYVVDDVLNMPIVWKDGSWKI